jgi:hypothetical protein
MRASSIEIDSIARIWYENTVKDGDDPSLIRKWDM